MRANLDGHHLPTQPAAAPFGQRAPDRTAQGATFQHLLQQQAPAPNRSTPSDRTAGIVKDLNWGGIYNSLTQPAPTPASVPSPAFANFGATPNDTDPAGGQTYNPMSNPLLTPQTSSTDLNGTLVTQNTSPTVTASAARQFAAVLGGSVVQLPTPWSNTAPVYGIELPGGQVLDGTAIANILGNNAAYPSAAVKSGEIAKLMNVAYTPAMANLATRLAGGANANLQRVNAGPGVMSLPVLTPAAGAPAAT